MEYRLVRIPRTLIFKTVVRSELKRLWFRTKEKISEWSASDPLMIAPYLSYANEHEIIIRGRVLENEGIVVKEDDGKWDNFVNSIKRMETDEAEEVKVLIRFQEKEYECITNDEGYFKLTIPTSLTPTASGNIQWATAYLSLPEYKNDKNEPIQAQVKIQLPHLQTKYALIADMDDTILESHVNSFLKLRLLYETFIKSPHARLAFENIAPVLHKLVQNNKGEQINPIFYLSHSPWNLYELLIQFIQKNDIPLGPFFLRDFGYKKGQEKYEYQHHKALRIEHLMNFHSNLSFILIGDATEHDVDVYTEAYKRNPSRVLKIIIRATAKEEKNEHVRDAMALNPNAPIYLIEHSDEILEIIK